MGKLTDWLDGFKVTPVPRHSKFPALVEPPNFSERPKNVCVTCPQQGKEGHESYGCGKLTEPLPLLHRVKVRAFSTLQYLLHRISGDLLFPYGATSGFRWEGAESVNFADRYTFRVLSAVGNVAHVDTWGEGDIRAFGTHLISRGNWGVPGRTFMVIQGTLQPNDRLVGDNSILGGKICGRVRKVTINPPHEATLEFDMDVSGLMVDNREDQTDPWVPTLTLIRYSGSPEQWTRVVVPSIMKCQKNFMSVKVEDLPEDRKLSLVRTDGSKGRVAEWEPATDERPATMQIWLRKAGVEELEEISSEAGQRLKGLMIGPGADERGEYDFVLCLGTKDHNDEEVFVDLITEDVEEVIVSYYSEVPDGYTGTDWCAVGSRRCVHAVNDASGSFYGMEDGEAHLSNGEEWYCAIRRTYEVVETIDGRWRLKWSKPSGVENFTADCSLRGTCSGYSPINKAGEGQRSFTLHRTANQIIKECTIGQDIGLIQYWPGYASYYVKRLGRPTIHGMTTMVPLSNPTDWSPNVYAVGAHLVGGFETGPPPYGDSGTYLNPLRGGVWDGRVSFGDLTFPNAPPWGIFPSQIPNWLTRKDALRRTLDDSLDKYKHRRGYEDDMGARVSRGVSPQTFGRGISQAVRVVGGDERFLLPKLSCADETAGEEQDRGDATFTWFDSNQVGPDGIIYRGLIKIKPLIATGKPPRGVVKTGKIVAAVMDGSELVFELENQVERWSRLRNEGFGNSWNETFTFRTGGKVFRPPDYLQIRSSETSDSSLGGNDWVEIGDAAWIDLDDEEFKKHRFTVTYGEAYDGTTEPDFGQTSVFISFDPVGGYYQVTDEDMELENGEFGLPMVAEAQITATPMTDSDNEFHFVGTVPFAVGQYLQVDGTDEVIQVYGLDIPNNRMWASRGVSPHYPAAAIPGETIIRMVPVYEPWVGLVYSAVEGETKPADIPTESFWYDRKSVRYYFSPADVSKFVNLSLYMDDGTVPVAGRGRYIENHQIFHSNVDGHFYLYPVIDTNKTPSEFDGDGDPTKVFLNGSEVEVITTGTPSAGKALRTTDGSGHVVLQFDRAAAGQSGRIEIDPGASNPFMIDVADVPEFATGIGWGRKRARGKLRDENGWLASNVSELIGSNITFVRNEQVLSPDSAPVVSYVEYQAEHYTDFLSSWVITDRGRGWIYLDTAAVNVLRSLEEFCLEVK